MFRRSILFEGKIESISAIYDRIPHPSAINLNQGDRDHHMSAELTATATATTRKQKEEDEKVGVNNPDGNSILDPDTIIAELKKNLSTEESDLETKKTTLIQLRELLIKHVLTNRSVIEKVIENGLIEMVFPYLEHEDIDLQLESGWILSNVAAGSSIDVNYLIKHGVIDKLMPLLYSSHDKVWAHAVSGYGNLAAESIHVRNMVNKEEIIRRIVAITTEQTQILRDSSVKSTAALGHVRNLAWAISNCCCGKPNSDFAKVKLFLPGLAAILESTDDEETLSSTCWALSFLSDGREQQVQEVLNSGFFPSMMKLMEKDSLTNYQLHLGIVRLLGNLCSGSDSQAQIVIDFGGIKILLHHVSDMYRQEIRKEACWALSNICAGTEEQIRAVVEYPNLLSSLMTMIATANYVLQKEMAWIFANIAEKGVLSFTLRLHEIGCVRRLVSLLNDYDVQLASNCLGAIYEIGKVLRKEGMIDEFEDFKDCIENNGGLDIIEQLGHSPSHSVRPKAVLILESFFDIMEEDIVGNGEDQRRNVINEG